MRAERTGVVMTCYGTQGANTHSVRYAAGRFNTAFTTLRLYDRHTHPLYG